MSMFDRARDAAKDYAAANPDKVEEAIGRVGEETDKRTGGKYTEQIDQAERKVADQMRGSEQQEQGEQA